MKIHEFVGLFGMFTKKSTLYLKKASVAVNFN